MVGLKSTTCIDVDTKVPVEVLSSFSDDVDSLDTNADYNFIKLNHIISEIGWGSYQNVSISFTFPLA